MELDFSSELIEKLLLKKALVDKKWLNILAGTYDSRWFKIKEISILLNLIVKYYLKYQSIPQNKVVIALAKAYSEHNPQEEIDIAGINQTMAEVCNLDLNISDDALNANLKEFIRRNAFYNALYDNSTLLDKSPENYEKVVDKCLENFDRVQKITFNDTDLGLDYFNDTAMAQHWDYIRNPEAKIKTGWQALDDYTNGGFLKEGRSLYLFMAQAGLGKSVFMSNLAVNFLKQNLSVVVISLEMSEDVYACRFDAHISNNNINRLKENEKSAMQRIKDFYAQHKEANLYIKEYPPKSITCNDIQVYLESLKNNGHRFDAVIVDYLNLVKSSTRTDNMFADGLDVSEKLRAISYTFKVPVISAVQTNTEGMNNEKVGMENISQSRGVAFTTDFLMALFQTEDLRADGVIAARILKNRLGGYVGKILNFKINDETLVLDDITFDPSRIDDSKAQGLNGILANADDIINDANKQHENIENL